MRKGAPRYRLVERAIAPDSDLSEYPGIGAKTAEYLQIVYAVNSGSELYQFLLEDEEQVRRTVGQQHFDVLRTELENQHD